MIIDKLKAAAERGSDFAPIVILNLLREREIYREALKSAGEWIQENGAWRDTTNMCAEALKQGDAIIGSLDD